MLRWIIPFKKFGMVSVKNLHCTSSTIHNFHIYIYTLHDNKYEKKYVHKMVRQNKMTKCKYNNYSKHLKNKQSKLTFSI